MSFSSDENNTKKKKEKGKKKKKKRTQKIASFEIISINYLFSFDTVDGRRTPVGYIDVIIKLLVRITDDYVETSLTSLCNYRTV